MKPSIGMSNASRQLNPSFASSESSVFTSLLHSHLLLLLETLPSSSILLSSSWKITEHSRHWVSFFQFLIVIESSSLSFLHFLIFLFILSSQLHWDGLFRSFQFLCLMWSNVWWIIEMDYQANFWMFQTFSWWDWDIS